MCGETPGALLPDLRVEERRGQQMSTKADRHATRPTRGAGTAAARTPHQCSVGALSVHAGPRVRRPERSLWRLERNAHADRRGSADVATYCRQRSQTRLQLLAEGPCL